MESDLVPNVSEPEHPDPTPDARAHRRARCQRRVSGDGAVGPPNRPYSEPHLELTVRFYQTDSEWGYPNSCRRTEEGDGAWPLLAPTTREPRSTVVSTEANGWTEPERDAPGYFGPVTNHASELATRVERREPSPEGDLLRRRAHRGEGDEAAEDES